MLVYLWTSKDAINARVAYSDKSLRIRDGAPASASSIPLTVSRTLA